MENELNFLMKVKERLSLQNEIGIARRGLLYERGGASCFY
jgi:hypothetical protein